jgi:DNA-binding SARP family transcriptional activator/tetratricopeptide (TPR) repeat protein
MNRNVIKRDRLEHQIIANLHKKLILVISHAGSGKTTLIESAIASSGVDHVWYSFETSDQEISSFLHHFVPKVQTYCPKFFKTFQKKLISSKGNVQPGIMASLMVNEFKQHLASRKRHVIILDNYEVVNSSFPINQIFDHTLKHLPNFVTFILCSTQMPNLHISKLGLQEEIHQINGSELAFSLEESQELFSNMYQIGLSEKDVQRIYAKTEGWITALILLAQFLRERPFDIEDLLKNVNGYGKAVSRYLMENVFQGQPKHIQEFLCKTALPKYLSPDICNRALGIKYGKKFLENLVDNNLFTFYVNSQDDSLYRYHPIMREFLLKKLCVDFPQNEIEEFHARLGEILTPTDQENAILHFISAKCFLRATEILRSLGEKMLHECRFKALGDLLESFPPAFVENDPFLIYFAGRVAEIRGETDQAFEQYEKACHLFKRQKESSSEIASLNRMAVINMREDNYLCAKDLLQTNIQWLEGQSMEKDVAHKLITGYTNLGEALFKLEEWNKAQSYLQKAGSLIDFYPNPYDQVSLIQCQAFKHIVEGDLYGGIEISKKGESLALASDFLTKAHVFCHYLAFSLLHLGHFSQSLEYAQKGLNLAHQLGVQGNITGGLYADLGLVQNAFLNYDQALKALESSLVLFRKGQNLCGSFWSSHALYHIALRMKDFERAKRYLQVLVQLAGKLGFFLETGIARIDQAHFLSIKGEEKEALELIETGQGHINQSLKRMSVFLANLIVCQIYMNLGLERHVENVLLESLKLLDEKNLYLYGVHQERNWLPAFLQRFVSKVPLIHKLLAEYQNIISGSSQSHYDIGKTPDTIRNGKGNEDLLNLRVYSLGPFRVFVENEEIDLSKCKSKKAVTLLKYFFLNRNKGPILKDFLLDLLWPDSPSEQADSNFRVTLSTLRKTLSQNGQKDFPNLLRKEGGYELSLGKEGWSDVDEFVSEMNFARHKEKKQDNNDTLRHYLNAENLYQGDFMMENVYEDWYFVEREHLKIQYLHALTKIINYHEEQHNLTEAVHYCYKILKVDPYGEDIFRKLMGYHFELGNRSEVRSIFELCRKNIEHDLGVALTNETKELYHKLSLC